MNNVIIYSAKYLILLPVLITIWIWLRSKAGKRWQYTTAVITGGIIALIIARIAAKLYYDPRPFVTQHIIPLIPHKADNGFPSDHTLLGATLSAVAFAYSRQWGLLAAIITAWIGTARVLAHIHSPIDIIGAFAIGIVGGCLGWWIARRFISGKNIEEPAPKSAAAESENPKSK